MSLRLHSVFVIKPGGNQSGPAVLSVDRQTRDDVAPVETTLVLPSEFCAVDMYVAFSRTPLLLLPEGPSSQCLRTLVTNTIL